jgi:hypothetical protein
MLGMHSGQHQGDLRRLPWSGYDGNRVNGASSQNCVTPALYTADNTFRLTYALPWLNQRHPVVPQRIAR